MAVSVKKDRTCTYRDYLSWGTEERWELIDGVAYTMGPAPSDAHQRVVGELFRQIANALVDHRCQVRVAPYDVQLDADMQKRDDDVRNVVQPDIVVICDPEKRDARGCRGVPDWVIEVVSPSTASRDYITKFDLYQRFRVPEYWIVHPVDKIVMVYRMYETGLYGKPEFYAAGMTETDQPDRVEVHIIDGLSIALNRI